MQKSDVWKYLDKMEDLIPHILIITVSISELNLQSKRETLHWI